MSRYSVGRPAPPPVYTAAGEIGKTDVVLSLLTRVRIVVHIPTEIAEVGGDLPPDFEPGLRKAVAEALVGTENDGFVVTYAAVGLLEDAGG